MLTRNMTAYNADEYRIYVEMSSSKHILVEGSDDKRLFHALISELYGTRADNVLIDTAENLIGIESVTENRQKVITVSAQISGQPFDGRFVGFIDREFEDFDYDLLQDKFPGHKVSGRLVRSRGHSIENYLLEWSALRMPLMILSPDLENDAIICMERVMSSILVAACAVGLAARDAHRLNVMRSQIRGNGVLALDGDEVRVNVDLFRTMLENTIGVADCDTFISGLSTWQERIRNANNEFVRWAADGHIATSTVWSVLDLCLGRLGRKSVQADRRVRWNLWVHMWAQQVKAGQCDYPRDVFALIDLKGTDVELLRPGEM